MKLLICGDRNWVDKDLIKLKLAQRFDEIELVIEGEARGADRLAREAATELGIHVLGIPADWDTYHRAAGPIRNKEMLAQGPDEVWVFHDHLKDSKGTKDMVRRAVNAGVKTIVHFHHQGNVYNYIMTNMMEIK